MLARPDRGSIWKLAKLLLYIIYVGEGYMMDNETRCERTRVPKIRVTRFGGKRRGISEIFGALMLILVVVVVVSGIAVFVAQAQKQQQDLQSFQTSIKNDQLEFTSMTIWPKDPNIDFELDGATPATSYYLQYVNESTVNLLPLDHSAATTSCFLVNGATPVKYSSTVLQGAQAAATLSPCKVDFSVHTDTVKPATIGEVTLTIRNLNIQDSGIHAVGINDIYAHKWYQVCQGGEQVCAGLSPGSLVPFDPTQLPISIPAKEDAQVLIKYYDPENAGLAPLKTSSLRTIVLSPATNFFKNTDSAPTPIAQISVPSEDYSITKRDVVTMDASKSKFGENHFAQQFVWRIDIPPITGWTGQWNDPNITTKYLTGEVVSYRPESIYNSTELNNLFVDGPIRITLKAVDDLGLSVQSGSIIVPKDPSLAPIGSLALNRTVNTAFNCTPAPSCLSPTTYNYTTVFVKVLDIFGRPVKGTGVTFSILPGSNSTAIHGVSTYFNVTNSTGMASMKITWTQTKAVSTPQDNYANIGINAAALPATLVSVRYDISYP